MVEKEEKLCVCVVGDFPRTGLKCMFFTNNIVKKCYDTLKCHITNQMKCLTKP